MTGRDRRSVVGEAEELRTQRRLGLTLEPTQTSVDFAHLERQTELERARRFPHLIREIADVLHFVRRLPPHPVLGGGQP